MLPTERVRKHTGSVVTESAGELVRVTFPLLFVECLTRRPLVRGPAVLVCVSQGVGRLQVFTFNNEFSWLTNKSVALTMVRRLSVARHPAIRSSSTGTDTSMLA